MDLLIGLAATAVAAALSLMTDGPLRVVAGTAFIIVVPGYCLIAALYPEHDGPDMAERLALSFGTSVCAVPLLMLVLNHTPWGVRLIPALATLAGFSIIMCIIAAVRRSRIYPPARFAPSLGPARPRLRGTLLSIHALSALRLACAALAIGVIIHVATTPKQAEEFTEFYLLGNEGRASDYPVLLRRNEPSPIIIGVVNHEADVVTYAISARLDADPSAVELCAPRTAAQQTNPHSFLTLPLEPGDTWEHAVDVTALTAGERLRLEFLLHGRLTRDGYDLWAALDGGGDAVLRLQESRGRATITAHAGDTAHCCRIEAWQSGSLVAYEEFEIDPGGRRTLTFRYPAGQTEFRVYDNGTLALEDSGALLNLHLWVDVQ